MSSLICLIIRKKKLLQTQTKKKERYAHLKKTRERENIIDTVTHTRHKKKQIMDYNNTDDGFGKQTKTFNKKKTQTYVQIKSIIKDNYVQESKKNVLSESSKL